MSGMVVGTIEYMAPEQSRGEAVDQRADIYAFGLILYDMLLNRRRTGGAGTAVAELTSRMQAAPPAPRSIDASIPEPLERNIMQCLEPDAAKRVLTEEVMLSEAFAKSEIDRYTFDSPGQATSYMVGRVEIQRMRAEAEARQGDRFSVKAFHSAVLDSGSLPLGVLDEVVRTRLP